MEAPSRNQNLAYSLLLIPSWMNLLDEQTFNFSFIDIQLSYNVVLVSDI